MAKPLPKWVMKRYSILWIRFHTNEFSKDAAHEALDKEKTVPIIISTLRKNGWLKASLDEKDSRKRSYRLRTPEEIITEIGKE